jgi:hypothetical protein
MAEAKANGIDVIRVELVTLTKLRGARLSKRAVAPLLNKGIRTVTITDVIVLWRGLQSPRAATMISEESPMYPASSGLSIGLIDGSLPPDALCSLL